MPGSKMKATDQQIIESYGRLGNIWRVAEEFGMCGQSVQERLIKLGVDRNNPPFTDEELNRIRGNYVAEVLAGRLKEFAESFGRTKPLICRVARKMGLTDKSRDKKLLANFKPSKPDWNKRPHPRGMAGKHHSDKTKNRLSVTSKRVQDEINADPDRRAAKVTKMMKTRYAKGNAVRQRPETSWKAGWREIGGKRKYFRSRWEANYARYLEFLKIHGEIKEWEHECEVFWFEGIKRGCMSYLPDFKVTNKDGSTEVHEVKGWMDDRSKTKINRMRIYHPNVKLVLIQSEWFSSNNRKLKALIQEWE